MGITLDQPSSSAIVYSLAIMWLWAGWRFWRAGNRSLSGRWWAIAMALGGIAALSAGTSYQAFGYELKCVGRELCTWTSWWEIAYLVMQTGSINAMLIAVAYTCTRGRFQRSVIFYARANLAIFCCVIASGVYLSNRFVMSFEMLVLFSTPVFALFFVINGLGYVANSSAIDKVLLAAWTIMVAANVLYYVYLLLGYTEALWDKGYWFSANDVLHVLMMGWVLYMGIAVVNAVNNNDTNVRVTSIDD